MRWLLAARHAFEVISFKRLLSLSNVKQPTLIRS
jgi:hypothetical protein